MAKQGVRVQIQHARGGYDFLRIGQNKRIHLQNPRLGAAEKRVTGLKSEGRPVEGLPVHAAGAEKRNTPLLAQAVQDIDFHPLERFGVFLQKRFNLHAALGAEHDERPARRAVEGDRKIPLLHDPDLLLDQQTFHGKMMHHPAQKFGGRSFRLIGRIRREDGARLAAFSHGRQRLHHDGAADCARRFRRFCGRMRRAATRDAHARIA